jgi:hypothetical protein
MNKYNITQEIAEKTIEQLCQENDWFFDKPITIINRWRTWKIVANSNMNDNNAWICIDKKTGRIIDRGFSITMDKEKARKIVRNVCEENNWFCLDEYCCVANFSSDEWSIGFVATIVKRDHLFSARPNTWIRVSKKTGQIIKLPEE